MHSAYNCKSQSGAQKQELGSNCGFGKCPVLIKAVGLGEIPQSKIIEPRILGRDKQEIYSFPYLYIS